MTNRSKANPWKAYDEAVAQSLKAYVEMLAQSQQLYDAAVAQARKAYIEAVSQAQGPGQRSKSMAIPKVEKVTVKLDCLHCGVTHQLELVLDSVYGITWNKLTGAGKSSAVYGMTVDHNPPAYGPR